MNPEHYKSVRNKPKNNSRISKTKKRMLAMTKEWKPNTSQRLSKIYLAKTEWTSQVIPNAKEPAPEIKEEQK